MSQINLQNLNLGKRWPQLARLQGEIASFEERYREAEAQVQQLQNQLSHAREQDLDAEAKAIRTKKKPPEPTHEPKVKGKLERATRDRDVMSRALQAAQTDLGAFLQKHRAELYQGVLQVRAEIGAEVAKAAREALAGYSRYETSSTP